MTPFDSYEISPCVRLDDAGLPDPNGSIYEVCEPDEAHVWTLYGHLPEGGVEAIGDFATREDAEDTFQRITGIPFGSHEDVKSRVRVMHAGPKLLKALEDAREWIVSDEVDGVAYDETSVVDRIDEVIAESTGSAA